jgi:hypothetical protein
MTSVGGLQLTEAHRLAQSRLAVQTTAEMTQFWQLLQPENLDATKDAWVRAISTPLVNLRERSASLAEVYQRAFQLGEIGTLDQYPAEIRVDANHRALTISMEVTGPIAAKTAMKTSSTLDQAMAKAFERAVGSATRYVLNGGREYVAQSILRNPRSQGYTRVTSGRPCYFCAMLASRGAVYKGDSFDASDGRFAGGGDVKVHDHCSCQIMSVYFRDEPAREEAQRWDALWQDNPTINDFRRAYDAAG